MNDVTNKTASPPNSQPSTAEIRCRESAAKSTPHSDFDNDVFEATTRRPIFTADGWGLSQGQNMTRKTGPNQYQTVIKTEIGDSLLFPTRLRPTKTEKSLVLNGCLMKGNQIFFGRS